MATPYPTLPLSVVDGLSDLNGALAAYHELMTAYINQTFSSGPAGDSKRFAAGCHFLLQPVLDGYQDIASQVESFRKLGTVSVLTTAESFSDDE